MILKALARANAAQADLDALAARLLGDGWRIEPHYPGVPAPSDDRYYLVPPESHCGIDIIELAAIQSVMHATTCAVCVHHEGTALRALRIYCSHDPLEAEEEK